MPYAYLAVRGRAATASAGRDAIRRSLEAELSFYGQVFGFEPADAIEPVSLAGLDPWQVRRAAGATTATG